jgi:tRNA G10  N-methylase Trm11
VATRTIHPFPARMAPEIALSAIPEIVGRKQLTIVDPMCGSGTVLSAAVSRGQRAIGVDIDPLAVLMSKVATTALDSERMFEVAQSVCNTADTHAGSAPWLDDETEAFVDFWFGAPQKRQLIALSSAISSVHDEPMRDALRVALSRIIITKSPQASLAADTSHSRPHRVVASSDYDILTGFVRSAKSLTQLLDARQACGRAVVLRGDSRRLDGIKTSSVDLVVTSPPYLNALDYMRGHKLALVWFGHSIPDLRRLRGASIGAERSPDKPASQRVHELVARVQETVTTPATLRLGMLERFAEDMVGFAAAANRVLKKTGTAVLVVGNSTLKGNYIQNDRITQSALEDHGFLLKSRTERDIPATSRYLAINTRSKDSSLRNRMRSEIILTMSRAA